MYKKWSENDIKIEINKIAEKFSYPCDIPIEISSRAKKRLGAFFYKKDRNKVIPVKFVFAKTLLDGLYPEHIVKEVIIHEYIHYFCDTKTGINNGHNKVFKEFCVRSGINANATLKYNVKTDYTKRVHKKEYKVYCDKCKNIVCVHLREDAAYNKTKKYISKCCKSRLKYRLHENK